MTPQEVHTLFHTLWTKAVGTERYDKEEWKRLSAFIYENIDTRRLTVARLFGSEAKIDAQRVSRYERTPVI